MENIAKVLIGIAALAFLLAVIGALVGLGGLLTYPPESFSRASNNLALFAIALILMAKTSTTGS